VQALAAIRRILFPIDFSSRAETAAAHVNAWAQILGASVVALHVVDPQRYSAEPGGAGEHPDELSVVAARRAGDLEYFCQHYLSSAPAERVIVTGETAKHIVDVAESRTVDLIMLPRTHQSLLTRWMHDSITALVLNASTIPVWLTEHLEHLPPPPPAKLLCALHVEPDLALDASNERLLRFARVLATSFRASITCLYVGHDSSAVVHSLLEGRSQNPHVEERLARIRQEMGDLADFEAASGDIRHAITSAAERKGADLILTGRTRPGTLGLGVQGHLLTLDHAAQCPIVSVL
jgi:nucleotide-binding universal stress UspA family protein